eukprot:142800-Pelagomonas_calceolata.AAC.3
MSISVYVHTRAHALAHPQRAACACASPKSCLRVCIPKGLAHPQRAACACASPKDKKALKSACESHWSSSRSNLHHPKSMGAGPNKSAGMTAGGSAQCLVQAVCLASNIATNKGKGFL